MGDAGGSGSLGSLQNVGHDTLSPDVSHADCDHESETVMKREGFPVRNMENSGCVFFHSC